MSATVSTLREGASASAPSTALLLPAMSDLCALCSGGAGSGMSADDVGKHRTWVGAEGGVELLALLILGGRATAATAATQCQQQQEQQEQQEQQQEQLQAEAMCALSKVCEKHSDNTRKLLEQPPAALEAVLRHLLSTPFGTPPSAGVGKAAEQKQGGAAAAQQPAPLRVHMAAAALLVSTASQAPEGTDTLWRLGAAPVLTAAAAAATATIDDEQV
eukprot:COSAG01_NODE_4936_length_4610_cov_4.930836_1_plen_217_part_00